MDRLFSHPEEDLVLRRGHRLVRMAESHLEHRRLVSLDAVIAELARMESLYGLRALVGPAPSWHDRLDNVRQAAKEARS